MLNWVQLVVKCGQWKRRERKETRTRYDFYSVYLAITQPNDSVGKVLQTDVVGHHQQTDSCGLSNLRLRTLVSRARYDFLTFSVEVQQQFEHDSGIDGIEVTTDY